MKRPDLLSGLVLLLLTVILAVESHGLAIWGRMGPKEGFFPLALSVLLGCFGVVLCLQGWLTKPSLKSQKVLGPKRGKLIVYVIAFILFALGLNWLGYTLTMALYILFILGFVERVGWRPTTITVLSCIVISYLLFVKLLSIPLPEGILTPAANFLREVGMKGS